MSEQLLYVSLVCNNKIHTIIPNSMKGRLFSLLIECYLGSMIRLLPLYTDLKVSLETVTLSVLNVLVLNSLRESWFEAAALRSLTGRSKGTMNSVINGCNWEDDQIARKDMKRLIIKLVFAMYRNIIAHQHSPTKHIIVLRSQSVSIIRRLRYCLNESK